MIKRKMVIGFITLFTAVLLTLSCGSTIKNGENCRFGNLQFQYPGTWTKSEKQISDGEQIIFKKGKNQILRITHWDYNRRNTLDKLVDINESRIIKETESVSGGNYHYTKKPFRAKLKSGKAEAIEVDISTSFLMQPIKLYSIYSKIEKGEDLYLIYGHSTEKKMSADKKEILAVLQTMEVK